MDKKYRINNFVCHELDEETIVVMHNKGIVKVKEPRLKNCIKNWDLHNQKNIDDQSIEHIFQQDYAGALAFMLDNYILEEEVEVNYSINKVTFLTNNGQVGDLVNQTMLAELPLPKKIEFLDNDGNQEFASETDCLYIVFLNPYNKKLAARIRDTIMNSKNSLLLMSYVYNNNFYIDSLYFPELHNPCHLCHIGHIESQLRINTDEGITYQQIIDSLYFEDANFSIHGVLTKNNILNIVTLLSNKVSKFILFEHGFLIFPEEMHECLMLDLQTNKVYTDYSLHWELCDCYE